MLLKAAHLEQMYFHYQQFLKVYPHLALLRLFYLIDCKQRKKPSYLFNLKTFTLMKCGATYTALFDVFIATSIVKLPVAVAV